MIKDLIVSHNKILIFITIANLIQLGQFIFWIINRTFKIVLTIFKQLYTIHRCVEGNENLWIMSLIYILMSSKSEECYKRLFEDLIDYSEKQNINLQSQFILTDFEQAAINAI